jgi:hypothetical protein
MVRPFERSRKNILTRRAITGISSSSQELSPRRKIRCGLFESDNTLSGNTLPGAPNLAARSKPNWLAAKADPADGRAPGEERWASRTGSRASAPWRKPSFKHLPSNT